MTTVVNLWVRNQMPDAMRDMLAHADASSAERDEMETILRSFMGVTDECQSKPIHLTKTVDVLLWPGGGDDDEAAVAEVTEFVDWTTHVFVDETGMVWFSAIFGPEHMYDFWNHEHGTGVHFDELWLTEVDAEQIGTEGDAIELLVGEGWAIDMDVPEALVS